MTHHNVFNELSQKHPLWDDHDSPIWIASHFSLKRNLASLPFSAKISATEKTQLLSLLKPLLEQSKLFKDSFSFSADALTSTEREWIAEHFFMHDLSPGELYLIDRTASSLAVINEEDHLAIHVLKREANWSGAWESLSELEASLSKSIPFAFNPQFGYLTSDPTLCGTAFRVQAFLHLPCLIHLKKLDAILENNLPDEVEILGLGEDQKPIGDLMILQNKFSLGLSEEHILESVHKVATKLTRLEAQEREALRSKKNPMILDKVSRGYGLLLHSYQTQTPEAFEALSLLKLAIDLQWASGMTDHEINRLFFSCRRGHLALESGEELKPDQLAIRRANFLKTECKKIELPLT